MPDRPHLCIVTQYYPPEMGAPQVRLSELAERLVARGWQVEVLTALPNYPRGEVFPGYDRRRVAVESLGATRVVRVPLVASRRGTVGRLATYATFMASAAALGPRHCRRPDLLLVESPPLFTAVTARWLARRWRVPYVFNVSDLWPESAIRMGMLDEGVLTRLAKHLEVGTYRAAAGVTGQSTEIIRSVAADAPGVPVEVITNGVDPGRFGPAQADAEARSLLAADGATCFVYAGLLGLAQGLDQILDAAALLPDTCDAAFRLVGTGPVREHLEQRCRDEGITRVTVVGELPRERIPATLAAADVAVITLGMSIPGAVPSKIYEAMASGLPILLVADGEAARRVEEAGCGLTVAPGDLAGLRDAVERLAASPELRAAMGAAGRAAAESTYDRDRIADVLDRFLHDRLPGHDGPTVDERARLSTVYRGYEDTRTEAWDAGNPGNRAASEQRSRSMGVLLASTGIDRRRARALDLGCGAGGGLAHLQALGFDGDRLLGVDLLPERLVSLPADQRRAPLLAADGRALPLRSGSLDVVLASTLFSSILDDRVARAVAEEIDRVLRPGGVVLWYDLRLPNPRNRHVRPYRRPAVRALFPAYGAAFTSATLLPALGRRLGPAAARLYGPLSAVPGLRTHTVAALTKPASP